MIAKEKQKNEKGIKVTIKLPKLMHERLAAIGGTLKVNQRGMSLSDFLIFSIRQQLG